MLHHIAAACEDTAFTNAALLPDFLEVQQLKQLIRKVVYLRDKAVLGVKSTQRNVIFCLRNHMAAVRTVCKVDQARNPERFQLFNLHIYQTFERSDLPLIQFRELLCQCVEFTQLIFTC